MGIHLDKDGMFEFSDPHEQFHMERYWVISNHIGPDNIVLDIGAAGGWGGYLLAKKSKKCFIVDIDPGAIERAKKNFPAVNITYVIDDVLKLQFPDNMFDVISACELIEHLDETDQDQMLKELKRVLKPGGILAISTPERNRSIIRRLGFQYPGHKHEMCLGEFVDMVSRFFVIKEIYGQDVGRRMFSVHVMKKILRLVGKVFDYRKIDFKAHPITIKDKASYIMVLVSK